MDSTKLLNKLINKENITSQEAEVFLNEVVKGMVDPSQIAAILVALRMKEETSDEIVGFIKTMRKNMIKVNLHDAIDVCGTGGDGSGTFNISTAVAFVVAGAGVRVAKHGNRAASSKCGSADVLEKLGVNIQLSAHQTEQVFNKVGMVFLFAPLFHPALKNVITVRRKLKVRTIFNYLGPFANPALAERQIIGVPDKRVAKKLAEVGGNLGYKHLLIVTGEDGLDEISTSSKTALFEIKGHSVKESFIDPTKFGFTKALPKELMGGNADLNANFIRRILEGEKSAKRDIVVLNSAYTLYVAGAVKDIKEGIKLAEESIDSRKAKGVLGNLIKETQKYA